MQELVLPAHARVSASLLQEFDFAKTCLPVPVPVPHEPSHVTASHAALLFTAFMRQQGVL